MADAQRWLDWAVELQSLAQAGLYYGKDVFDRERYARIREIAAEMVSCQSELPLERVRDLFCNETGYQTPKLDTRAAIVQDGKILLVRETDGRWSLPGGWCDVNVSVGENAVKEVREEAGLDVVAERPIRRAGPGPTQSAPVCLRRVQGVRPVPRAGRAVPA